MKFSVDQWEDWNVTQFIIQYIDVEQKENIQDDTAFGVFALVNLGIVTYLKLFW